MFTHPSFKGREISIAVELQTETAGRWIAEGQIEPIEVKREGDRVLMYEKGGLTVFTGQTDTAGALRGEVIQQGAGGGTFALSPCAAEVFNERAAHAANGSQAIAAGGGGQPALLASLPTVNGQPTLSLPPPALIQDGVLLPKASPALPGLPLLLPTAPALKPEGGIPSLPGFDLAALMPKADLKAVQDAGLPGSDASLLQPKEPPTTNPIPGLPGFD